MVGRQQSGSHSRDEQCRGTDEWLIPRRPSSSRTWQKRFGDLEVLTGVSLEAHEGDVIAILGSSGSGKSTMLRCINLLETPDTGRVYVAGELIKMKPTRDGHATPEDHKQVDRIRSELGMVFQSFNLWSHTDRRCRTSSRRPSMC